MTLKEQWLKERRFRITASDIPVIMGCSPFRGRGIPKKTTEDLILEKLAGKQIEPNLAMRFGSLYEPAHLQLLGECGLVATGNTELRTKDGWLGATVDGYLEGLSTYEPKGLVPWAGFPVFRSNYGVLEMKNTSRSVQAEPPEDYWWQLQCGIHVSREANHVDNLSGVLFVKYGSGKAMLYPVEYDELACQEMEKAARKVWEELDYRRTHP